MDILSYEDPPILFDAGDAPDPGLRRRGMTVTLSASAIAPRRRRLAVMLLTLALCCGAAACSSDDAGDGTTSATTGTGSGDPLLATTDLGDVQGIDSAVEGVRAFHAMPYAAEPSGDNRWRPPEPRASYDGTFDATTPGAMCPQSTVAVDFLETTPNEQTEDCLTLSVWSPTGAADLPVMVWFHGGSFISGSGEQVLFIGDDLAANGVVVVTVNFRQGPFGFLATEELAAESGDGSVGNYGLADQQAALEWVQRNIAALGGDPDNVTIFGESSGGYSVCAHLAAPASQGLFAKAIIQSGSGCGRAGKSPIKAQPEELDTALQTGAAFLDAAGCSDLACLRALPTDQVLATSFDPRLVADGVALDASARQLAEDGTLAPVPVMIGSNATEQALFSMNRSEPTDEELLALFAEETDRPDELLALYPTATSPSNLERSRTMKTDVRFACQTLAFATVNPADTFVYYFDYVSPTTFPFELGPTHGAELGVLFAHPEGFIGLQPGLTGEDATVSEELQTAWVSFATTGDPGDAWAPYAQNRQVTVIADGDAQLVDQIRDGRCPAVLELTGGTS